MNLTCNSTLDDLRIEPGDEVDIVGNLTFHDLARIIGAGATLISVVLSLYLVMMHAIHYTKPREQRHIIRILLMVPVYAVSSLLQIQWYYHAIYFQVLSDCYEAFAIASFFALLCHYIAPDLHGQKEFFRQMQPVAPWVWPVNWLAKCCGCGGRDKGMWRTPKSGLTWFNIIWIGIYQYCFIRVAMTVTSVVTQYFHKFCEASNLPVFAHIWTIVINSLAVTVAMYCVIQFYVQLRAPLAEHKPFIKVLSIKLVIFLSFWQASFISVGTSTLHIVHAGAHVAYPDIKVGIPALLLCLEMSVFAVLHLWAFPYSPYRQNAQSVFYPSPDLANPGPMGENALQPNAGGFLGLAALVDALNPWDFVKAFGRGIRWLFCGVRRRKDDVSYKVGLENLRGSGLNPGGKPTDPYRFAPTSPVLDAVHGTDEHAGLMSYAQPNPEVGHAYGSPPRPYRDPEPYGAYQAEAYPPQAPAYSQQQQQQQQQPAAAHEPYAFHPGGAYQPYGAGEETGYDSYAYTGGRREGQESGTTWGGR